MVIICSSEAGPGDYGMSEYPPCSLVSEANSTSIDCIKKMWLGGAN